jgi:hypothetical protein
MNTLQNVYNKLSDKTELAKHEVELASIQVLQDGLKKVPIAIKQIQDLKNIFKQKVLDIESKTQFGKEYSAVKQQALELGINPETIPEIKNYYSIIKTLADEVNKAIY